MFSFRILFRFQRRIMTYMMCTFSLWVSGPSESRTADSLSITCLFTSKVLVKYKMVM